MSTIASPREPSSLRRVPSRTNTPTSSTRPSLDVSRSGLSSPVNGPAHTAPASSHASSQQQQQQATQPKRSNNRAALREYYNLRAPRIEVSESEVPSSELDAPDFDADAQAAKITAESSLEELLQLYTKVLVEIRALDAEKKALVYDNYSKLITATETIRKMRTNMDPLNPMTSTLDPAIAQIYSQASSIREILRASLPPTGPGGNPQDDGAAAARRRRTRELAIEALATPEMLRSLVEEGKLDEAKKQWELPRKLLERWRELGVGGADVQRCIEEGDAALNRSSGQAVPAIASQDIP